MKAELHREEFDRASQALLEASAMSERRIALRRQLAAALGTRGTPARSSLPEWLWDRAEVLAAAERERRAPDAFTAWRLARWATLLRAGERVSLLDAALDAFEALIPTPVGPGNDAGPFTEVYDSLSLSQARRALDIAVRMQASGWGEESLAATASVCVRLLQLGDTARAQAELAALPESHRRWAEEQVAARIARVDVDAQTNDGLARAFERASCDEIGELDPSSCARLWTGWLSARAADGSLEGALHAPQVGSALRLLGGTDAIHDLRILLTRAQ